MDSEPLLALALLGGYVLIHSSHYLRYRSQALNGTRLLFECAAAGIPLLVVARLIVRLPVWPSSFRNAWRNFSLDAPYSGTIFGALVLALFVAFVMNMSVGWYAWRRDTTEKDQGSWIRQLLAQSREISLEWAIERYGNSFQKMQHFAAIYADHGTLVGVTLASRRIYAGFVVKNPDLSPNDVFVELLPVMSGYRSAETLSASYDYLYPMFQSGGTGDPALGIHMLLSSKEIQSMHLLDTTDLESWASRLGVGGSTELEPVAPEDGAAVGAPDAG